MNVPGAIRSTLITAKFDGERVILLQIESDAGGRSKIQMSGRIDSM